MHNPERSVSLNLEPSDGFDEDAVLDEAAGEGLRAQGARFELSLGSFQDAPMARWQVGSEGRGERGAHSRLQFSERDPAFEHADLRARSATKDREQHVIAVGLEPQFPSIASGAELGRGA